MTPVQDFLGAWRLVSVAYRDADGNSRAPFGSSPHGVIMYDASGMMAVQIMRDDRPAFAIDDMLAGSDAEVRTAFEGLNTYYGRFTINETNATVTHHLDGASLPNREGSMQVRGYVFSEDKRTLTLTAPPRQLQGDWLTGMLVWERISILVPGGE